MKMRSTNSPIKTIASNAPAEDCIIEGPGKGKSGRTERSASGLQGYVALNVG